LRIGIVVSRDKPLEFHYSHGRTHYVVGYWDSPLKFVFLLLLIAVYFWILFSWQWVVY